MSQKRKLDTQRLYRLITIAVLVVSAYGLYTAFINFLSLRNDHFQSLRNQCPDDGYASCLQMWYRIEAETERQVRFGLELGVGLPTLFFGGTWVFNYLLPKRDEKDDK